MPISLCPLEVARWAISTTEPFTPELDAITNRSCGRGAASSKSRLATSALRSSIGSSSTLGSSPPTITRSARLIRFVGMRPPALPEISSATAWECPVPKAWMTPLSRTQSANSSPAAAMAVCDDSMTLPSTRMI
jgi:hypothetical protein